MLTNLWANIVSYFKQFLVITSVTVKDAVEIVIIAFAFYAIMMWFKRTRAWALFKGILIIIIVVIIAALFQLDTIYWIASKAISVGIIGIFVLFQPELRRALEQLGRGKMFTGLFGTGKKEDRISDKNIEEIIYAVFEMSKARTGALICIEKDIPLGEYESTGIEIDAEISQQLLLNIFENKTPLHDGAVIIRDDRITSATCYLPMSESMSVNKQYGTRHRAGLGLSETTDAFVIIVSEETGKVSLALGGELIEDVKESELKNRLFKFQSSEGDSSFIGRIKQRITKDEDKADTKEMADK